MKVSKVKSGLKNIAETSKDKNIVGYSKHAINVITSQQKKIQKLEQKIDGYQKVDRESMIGKLNV